MPASAKADFIHKAFCHNGYFLAEWMYSFWNPRESRKNDGMQCLHRGIFFLWHLFQKKINPQYYTKITSRYFSESLEVWIWFEDFFCSSSLCAKKVYGKWRKGDIHDSQDLSATHSLSWPLTMNPLLQVQVEPNIPTDITWWSWARWPTTGWTFPRTATTS